MPIISVVVPIYNVEPYLEECINSICNQNFRDIEIICINDGSTDGSPAILEKMIFVSNLLRTITCKE